jgi:hypothetical protein
MESEDPLRVEKRETSEAANQNTGCGWFVKGGFGCLGIFFAFGILMLLVGGHFYFDFGGLIMLFILGGILGLIARSVFNAGKRSASK